MLSKTLSSSFIERVIYFYRNHFGEVALRRVDHIAEVGSGFDQRSKTEAPAVAYKDLRFDAIRRWNGSPGAIPSNRFAHSDVVAPKVVEPAANAASEGSHRGAA